ncbi:MAG: type II toxin-antitoxin system RelE/ParE family toxin [Opitutaceae bacterium]|jgi:toxin ParE1/3/4|nr:type II toxin-antitoxin system RelE/ParE family toxin [Opitutaceae bacterium]HRG56728.1 type II toxin-antitoxin system RelE/ParE family toxin [Lacunisphaera sp.]
MGYKVILGAKAERDLIDIVEFIAQGSPLAAEKIGAAILDAALALDVFPCRGRVVAFRPGFRRIAVPPHYAIFYRVNESSHLVEIATIWDGRRNPADLNMS